MTDAALQGPDCCSGGPGSGGTGGSQAISLVGGALARARCGTRQADFECTADSLAPHELLRRTGDIGSLWVDVQRIMSTFHLSFSDCADATSTEPLGLCVPHHDQWLDHKTILRHVKLHMKICHQTLPPSLVDQGKTARVHGGLCAKFAKMGA